MAARPLGPRAWTTPLAAVAAAVRAAFGVIWAINAYLAWRPDFSAHYVGYLTNAQQGQPSWLQWWFGLWLAAVNTAPDLFIILTQIVETVIALGLLLGLARKWIYVTGGLFSIVIWATAEGFGGPYTVGATNPGPGLVYVLVFLALIIVDRAHGRTPYSVDYHLERRWPGWSRVAEWAPQALQTGVSTYALAPGQGVVFDLVIPDAGLYPFVDHSMRDMNIGAVGVLQVE